MTIKVQDQQADPRMIDTLFAPVVLLLYDQKRDVDYHTYSRNMLQHYRVDVTPDMQGLLRNIKRVTRWLPYAYTSDDTFYHGGDGEGLEIVCPLTHSQPTSSI
jgi:hypothetical protein